MSADFSPDIVTPTLKPVTTIKPFEYWVQSVLPSVYDDSLSYQELLGRVVKLLNDVITNVNTDGENVTTLSNAFTANFNELTHAYDLLQNYVNQYFENLDVQEEINRKLDTMAIDGTLSSLISPYVSAPVQEWLENNITIPESGILIDDSFTISEQAPDSALTGYRTTQNKTAINDALTFIPSANYWDTEHQTTTTDPNVPSQPVIMSGKVPAPPVGSTFYFSAHANNPNALAALNFRGIYGYDMAGVRHELAYSIGRNYWTLNTEGYEYIQFMTTATSFNYFMVVIGSAISTKYTVHTQQYWRTRDYKGVYDQELILPSKICLAPGYQNNFYFYNALMNGCKENSAGFTVSGTFATDSKILRDRVICTPTNSTSTSNTNIIYHGESTNQESIKQTVSILRPASSAGSGEVKVLIIGDSKVGLGALPRRFYEFFTADSGMSLTMLGGKTVTNYPNVHHEGYNGATTTQFCTSSTLGANAETNPFYNASYSPAGYSSVHFDFGGYMSAKSYSSVDYVFINLGTNDYTTAGAETRINDCATYLSGMIASIHAYNSDVKVVIGLNEGVYFPNYANLDRNGFYLKLNKKKISVFDNQTANKVYICPLYLGMDLYNDYVMESEPLSEADSVTGNGKTREYPQDEIHQNQAGYWKNGLQMYAVIKADKGGLFT